MSGVVRIDRIVGIGDLYGAVYHERGLDLAVLEAHVAKNGAVKGFSEASAIRSDELLELPCDVLVPAAAENQITRDNAAPEPCHRTGRKLGGLQSGSIAHFSRNATAFVTDRVANGDRDQ